MGPRDRPRVGRGPVPVGVGEGRGVVVELPARAAMTNYARGRRKEWDVVKRLRAQGWRAQRSAGSKGLWDVVAVKSHQPVRLIQVKYSKGMGGGWMDDNWFALTRLAFSVPTDVEAWVYRYGTAEPELYNAHGEQI